MSKNKRKKVKIFKCLHDSASGVIGQLIANEL